ncbi:MAG: hypothetical protein HY282_06640 [Nitrospirae bacterium]|nr:hypothetical protein [Candidatus Manganitrophaceae bacterium]
MKTRIVMELGFVRVETSKMVLFVSTQGKHRRKIEAIKKALVEHPDAEIFGLTALELNELQIER